MLLGIQISGFEQCVTKVLKWYKSFDITNQILEMYPKEIIKRGLRDSPILLYLLFIRKNYDKKQLADYKCVKMYMYNRIQPLKSIL